MNAAVLAWAVPMAILLAAAIYLRRENRRNPGPPSRLHQVLASHDQAERDRLDSMIDVVSDRRDEGNQNLAWPPDTQAPPLIEKLPPRIARDECGCLWFQGGLWSPCGLHDTGILQAHIDTYADQWAWDLAEGDDQ